jgi:hypothetical protein
MARHERFPHLLTSDAQLLLEFSSRANYVHDTSEVCKTPETPETPEQADNTPQFSPMPQRQPGFEHVLTREAQVLLDFSSGANFVEETSEVCETPEHADNTPQFSPMPERQPCFGHASKRVVKRPKGVVGARRAGSDVGRRVRVMWIPYYVKAKNPPKSKMLWFDGTVIEHSTTRKVRTHKVLYDDDGTVAWHDARGMQRAGYWQSLPIT